MTNSPLRRGQFFWGGSVILASNDGFIFFCMFLTIAFAFALLRRSGLIFVRIGIAWAAVMICVGWAYFGWQPFLGGPATIHDCFGCIMLSLGVCVMLTFAAIGEFARRFEHDASIQRGFPVIPAAASDRQEGARENG